MDTSLPREPLPKGRRYCWCLKCKGKAVSRSTFDRHGQVSQIPEVAATIRAPGQSGLGSPQPEASSSRTVFAAAEGIFPASSTAEPRSAASTSVNMSARASTSVNLSRSGSAQPNIPPPLNEGEANANPDSDEESTGRGESRKRAVSDEEIDAAQKRARESSPDNGVIDDDHPMEYHGQTLDELGGGSRQSPELARNMSENEQEHDAGGAVTPPQSELEEDSDEEEYGPSHDQVLAYEAEMARQRELAEQIRQEEIREAEAEAIRRAAQAANLSDDAGAPNEDYAEYLTDLAQSKVERLHIARQFVEAIQAATLENGKMLVEDVERLRNPPQEPSEDLKNKDVVFSLDTYMSMAGKASEAAYTEVRDAVHRRFNEPPAPGQEPTNHVNMLSAYSIKKLLTELTGITAIHDDMCIEGCLAYTGPYEDLLQCPKCGTSRYTENPNARKKKNTPNVSRQHMITIPLGPQLQAMRLSEEGAKAMRFRAHKLAEMGLEEDEDGDLPEYDDLLSGSHIRDLADNQNMTEDDIMVGFSFDGAQLYRNKESDVWVGVWIVYDLHPTLRYKRKHILPALIVPGPKKPSNLDSYLFRSFHHLSSLQRENNNRGMKAWDALKRAIILSRIFFVLGMADTVGLTDLDGRTGHHAAHPCRVGCDFTGRYKDASGGHYYSAHLRPSDAKKGSDKPDFDIRAPLEATTDSYDAALRKILAAQTQKEYENLRRDTGISKPSLVSGLLPTQTLQPPHCFSLDIMHLIYINLAQLLVLLFRGELRVERPDKKTLWDWVVLLGDIWEMVGKAVQEAGEHYPSHFHRPPRNPCEKINSGYKATEYYKLVFDLFPAFLYGLLEEKYWQNLCRVTHAVRILVQRSIKMEQVEEVREHMVLFVEEFENLYYQRKLSRMHFCRALLHSLLHTGPEIPRMGPGAYNNQFPLERTIGELGSELRQPGSPYANLMEIVKRRSQINAVKVLHPELDHNRNNSLPKYAKDAGGGFVFLRPRQSTKKGWDQTDPAIRETIEEETNMSQVAKWGRLRLPNGQICRSYYCESNRKRVNQRISRNVKVQVSEGLVEYGEVQFFFFAQNGPENLDAKAIVSFYGAPNEDIYRRSYTVLKVCNFAQLDDLRVIDVAQILSVISMQPMPPWTGFVGKWFVVEKSGLEDAELAGWEEPIEDEPVQGEDAGGGE